MKNKNKSYQYPKIFNGSLSLTLVVGFWLSAFELLMSSYKIWASLRFACFFVCLALLRFLLRSEPSFSSGNFFVLDVSSVAELFLYQSWIFVIFFKYLSNFINRYFLFVIFLCLNKVAWVRVGLLSINAKTKEPTDYTILFVMRSYSQANQNKKVE